MATAVSSPMSTSVIVASTMFSGSATPTSSSNASGGTSSNSHASSPLLFFVALGFGVLFTNLWIIIGVKYCFRYQNARRRGIPMNGPDGVPMGTMHNGRRRREKKLMTMEEVEAQFPQMTYKAWRAQRERQGLSTEGGVEAVGQEEAQHARKTLSGAQPSVSRPGSVRTVRSHRRTSMHSIEPADTNNSGIYEVGKVDYYDRDTVPPLDKSSSPPEKSIVKGSTVEEFASVPLGTAEEPKEPESPTSPVYQGANDRRSHVFETTSPADNASVEPVTVAEPEVDEAEIAHLPEDIGSGDTCAICIDQLEEDDEVRGLACGHAFHSSCVDVWLTTRRAICPLCKKDYWVRKTNAGTTAAGDDEATGGATGGPVNGSAPRWRTNYLSRRFAARRTRAAVPADDLETGQASTAASAGNAPTTRPA